MQMVWIFLPSSEIGLQYLFLCISCGYDFLIWILLENKEEASQSVWICANDDALMFIWTILLVRYLHF